MMRDVVFQYDGTFEGFLCCIFDSYVYKEFPIAFFSDEECISLYEVRSVITQPEHAQRVYRSLVKLSRRSGDLLCRAFLTCMEDKELYLYAFVRKLYARGPDFMRCQSDEVYYPICQAVRHLNGEIEKLRGFVRFSDYSGVLGAEITPKNRVLPLLRNHFCNRYANESFFIYDRTHKELLLYSSGHSRIVSVDNLQLALPGEEEIHYRSLWKCFYESIAIKERHNPRCQNTFLPKRYRGDMTEFLPVNYEAQQANTPATSPAVLPDPCVPIGKPVLEIPR